MSSNDLNQESKPVNKAQMSRVNNEPEKRTEFGKESIKKEVGLDNDESSGKMKPSQPEIGRTINEGPGKKLPGKPEIGRTNNEPAVKK